LKKRKKRKISNIEFEKEKKEKIIIER